MVADELDYVVGVDTHLDEHVLAVVAAPSGAVVARRSVQASGRGYAAAFRFAADTANGARVWAIEGTGSYGAGLARYLVGRGETVLETSRLPQSERRLRGKDDALDAVRTARAILASDTLALPRAGERRDARRLLLVARRSAGVAPVPASSGKTARHRLSRGGDRQLNRAIHTIVLHRRQHDPATRDYIERRIAEGKTRRDATRLLKRYLARHLYRLLEQQQPIMA